MERTQQIAVVGAGAWGTAVAKVLAEKGHHVRLWAFEQELPKLIETTGENTLFLQGIPLPKNVSASNNLQEVVTKADVILLAVPSLFLLSTVKELTQDPATLEKNPSIGILSKGLIEVDGSPLFITQALEHYLPACYKDQLVYISGPSHAEEVGLGKITGLIAASKSPKETVKMRNLLTTSRLFTFSSFDVIGVQVCAIMKNIIAIGFGIMDALTETDDRFGGNTESLLLASGLHELQIFGRAMGASHSETFSSIAGVGDLDVTCRSPYGRNRRFGREIITKNLLDSFQGIDDIIARVSEIGYIPEGLVACYHVVHVAKQQGIRLEITQGLYQILNKEQDPVEVITSLITKVRRR